MFNPVKFYRKGGMVSILFILILVVMVVSSAHAVVLPGPLVDVKWLYEHLDEVVVLDVRKDLESFGKRRRGGDKKRAFNPCGIKQIVKKAPIFGHIPGAVLVPWEEVLADRKTSEENLLRILPDPQTFQSLMRRLGVNDDSLVVITTRGMNTFHMTFATRLYWSLKMYGHDKVALLNGGTAKWVQHKRRTRLNASDPSPGNFTAKEPIKKWIASTSEMVQWVESESKQIVDSRESDYFEGLTVMEKFVKSEAEGHISDAINIPFMSLLDTTDIPVFLSRNKLRLLLNKKELDANAPTVFYCNIGVQGSLGWFVFSEILGNPHVSLYDGSMHAWSQDPDREVVGF